MVSLLAAQLKSLRQKKCKVINGMNEDNDILISIYSKCKKIRKINYFHTFFFFNKIRIITSLLVAFFVSLQWIYNSLFYKISALHKLRKLDSLLSWSFYNNFIVDHWINLFLIIVLVSAVFLVSFNKADWIIENQLKILDILGINETRNIKLTIKDIDDALTLGIKYRNNVSSCLYSILKIVIIPLIIAIISVLMKIKLDILSDVILSTFSMVIALITIALFLFNIKAYEMIHSLKYIFVPGNNELLCTKDILNKLK